MPRKRLPFSCELIVAISLVNTMFENIILSFEEQLKAFALGLLSVSRTMSLPKLLVTLTEIMLLKMAFS